MKEYNFSSKTKGSEIGSELIISSLTGWAITDLGYSDVIKVNYPLSGQSEDFIKDLTKIVSKLFVGVNGKKLTEANFFEEKKNLYEPTELNSEFIFLGVSGGKDSSLVEKILNLEGKSKIARFSIDYSGQKTKKQYQIWDVIHDSELFKKVNPNSYKNLNNNILFLESNDIGVTFLAPYFDVKNQHPSRIAYGLQWDTAWEFSEIKSSLVPLESKESIDLHKNYMRSLGLKDFEIELPIQSIHTNAVYMALEKLTDFDTIANMISCWEYENYNCGDCPKCQRVGFVLDNVFGRQVSSMPLLAFDPVLVYGSINAGDALKNYPNIDWNKSVISKFDNGINDKYINIIGRLLDAEQINENDLRFDFRIPEVKKDKLKKQIVEEIGINYDVLSDEKVNNFDVPFLPFEKYYGWNRNNKVLNCYGTIPKYSGKKKNFDIISKGPRLFVPDIKMFDIFFQEKSEILW